MAYCIVSVLNWLENVSFGPVLTQPGCTQLLLLLLTHACVNGCFVQAVYPHVCSSVSVSQVETVCASYYCITWMNREAW